MWRAHLAALNDDNAVTAIRLTDAAAPDFDDFRRDREAGRQGAGQAVGALADLD